ncbi:MAG: hypothetical protein R3F39_07465 [Myxococcota bacterium]
MKLRDCPSVFACTFIVALGALAAGGCASDDQGSPPTGTLHAALGMDGPTHDVTHVGYRILEAGADCADAAATVVVGPSFQPLESESLPPWLEPDPPGGDNHPFADLLAIVAPGDYVICARAMATAGDGSLVPSTHCGSVSGTATVVAEQTTEVVLMIQCEGDPTGGLDVVVALNDPPQIDDLVIDPSKFITTCETATVTVFASDPNGDALNYTWSETLADGTSVPLAGSGATLSYGSLEPGVHQLLVVVDDGHGATAQLSFPVHVSAGADCGPGFEGDCCVDSTDDGTGAGTPGCEDPDVTDCVCALDPFCCAVAWDAICVDEAINDCGTVCDPGGPVCGDGTCDGGEDCGTCADDCGACATCGDGICGNTPGEACDTCPSDCGSCCGDGVCDPAGDEDCATCEADCGACAACGDGICGNTPGEACDTCPSDCGSCCGDGVCVSTQGEDCSSCPSDCGACAICGDEICGNSPGEDCNSCPGDCGACASCGDGVCGNTPGEDCSTCAADCGACCGDGVCNAAIGEDCVVCEADCGACCGDGVCDGTVGEDCASCASDCGACCGDGTCDASVGEDCGTCTDDCGACPSPFNGTYAGDGGATVVISIPALNQTLTVSCSGAFDAVVDEDSAQQIAGVLQCPATASLLGITVTLSTADVSGSFTPDGNASGVLSIAVDTTAGPFGPVDGAWVGGFSGNTLTGSLSELIAFSFEPIPGFVVEATAQVDGSFTGTK